MYAATLSTASTEEKQEAILAKYALNQFKEAHCEDEMYALSTTVLDGADGMDRVMTGVQPLELQGWCGEAIDDSFLLSADVATAAAGVGIAVFKPVHLMPRVQKLMRNPVSRLRQDHIAIRTYNVHMASPEHKEVLVSASLHEDSVPVLKMLSLSDIVQLDHDALKDQFLRLKMSGTFEYSLAGYLPARVKSIQPAALKGTITSIIDCGAYPGPSCLWEPPSSVAPEVLTSLVILVEENLADIYAGKRFRITDEGFQNVIQF